MQALRFSLIEGVLHGREVDEVYRRYILLEEEMIVLLELHDFACGGHFTGGRLTAQKILRAEYWWPTIFSDSYAHVQTCDTCQRFDKRANRTWPLIPIQPILPFEKWGVDYVGPIHLTSRGCKNYIIVAADYFMKWPKARDVHKDNAKETARFLMEHVICQFGLPRMLLSDRGTHFLNKVIKSLTTSLYIRHEVSIPYNPQANGQVESTNDLGRNGSKAQTGLG